MTIEERVTNLEALVALHAELFERLVTAIEELTTAVGGVPQRLDRLESRMDASDVRTEIEELTTAVSGVPQRLDRLESRMDASDVRTEIEELTTAVSGVPQRLDRLESRMDASDVRTEIEELTTAVSGVPQRLDRLESRMDASDVRTEAGLRLVSAGFERVEARLTNLETDMSTVKGWLDPRSGDGAGL